MTFINTANWDLFNYQDGYYIYRGLINMLDHPFNDDNDTIDLRKSPYTTQIYGGNGRDTIYGSSSHMNFLYGDKAYEVFGTPEQNVNYLTISNSDKIYGGNSSDYVDGGGGDDYINAGKGINVILCKQGDGVNTIANGGGSDYLYFADTRYSDLHFERQNNDLIIEYGNDSRVIILEYFIKTSVKGIADMYVNKQEIQAAFNAFYTTTEKEGLNILKRALVQTHTIEEHLNIQNSLDSNITSSSKYKGSNYNENINGSGGNDTIIAGINNDTITAGAGNDYITGGTGTNIINYSIGDGNDTIVLTKGERFTLNLTGLLITDFSFSKEKNNLIMSYNKNDKEGSITLLGFASKDVINNSTAKSADTSLMRVVDSVDTYDLKTYLYDFGTTNKNFTGSWLGENIAVDNAFVTTDKKGIKGLKLDGGAGNDRLTGSKYADTLIGGKGEDSFVFENNFSEDTIKDGSNEDTIEFSDLKLSQLKFFKNGNNLEIRNTENVNNKVIVSNYFKTKQEKRIEKLTVLNEYGTATENILLSAQPITVTGKGNINGSKEADDILGSETKDTVKGNEGNDTINAGKGNDNISGGKGADTFIFAVSDGVDTIKDGLSDDTIQFTDLELENLSFIRNGNNLEIYNTENGLDKVVVANYFKTKVNDRIDKLVDSTETEYSIKDQPIYITGKGKINGFADDNYILGSTSDDTINAGKGNDTINAGLGNNTITFKTGDGNDIVKNGNGKDWLIFSNEKNVDNIGLSYNDLDLVLTYGKNDSVTIEDYSENHSVQTIKVGKNFYNINDLLEARDVPPPEDETINGTNGNDTINSSTSVNHIVDAKQGNDVINVLKGNNTYIFNADDGNDTIISGTGNDTISFSTAQALSYSHDCANDDLVISYGDSDKITLKDYFVNNSHSVATIINGSDTLSLANEIQNGMTITGVSSYITVRGLEKNYDIYSPFVKEFYLGAGDNKFNHYMYNEDATVYGEDGNDEIYGWGDDGHTYAVVGGKGNDYISISGHTIILNNGDGHDMITGQDVESIIKFNDSVFSDLSLENYGEGLLIKYNSGNDSVLIVNYQSYQTYTLVDKNSDAISLSDFVAQYGEIPDSEDTQIIGTDRRDYIEVLNSNIEEVHLANGDDEIYITGTSNAIVYGDDGNDKMDLYNEYGNMTIVGGRGNDYITSGINNDINTLIFNNGDGRDFVSCENSIIKFADSLLSELSLETYGNGLLIKYNSGLDSILFSSDTIDYSSNTITITDKEGEDILLSDLILQRGPIPVSTDTQIIGTDGHDHIIFWQYQNPNIEEVYLCNGDDKINGITNATIYGENGNDYIMAGNSTIIGGKGNDNLILSEESDGIFILNKGDGNDVIDVIGANNAIIKFADSLLPELSLQTVGNDLLIKYNSGSDSVLLIAQDFDYDGITLLDKNYTNMSLIDFATQYGAILEYSESTISGTNGNDTINSSNDGPNFIQGKAGNDIYNVSSLDNYVNIFDESGNNDVININANKDDLILKFDLKIDNEGNIVDELFKSLYITNQSDFTNYYSGIKVANQFVNGHEIEKITTADGYYITATQINELRENIADWIHNNSAYTSVQQIIGSNNTTENLIAQFQTVDWQQVN